MSFDVIYTPEPVSNRMLQLGETDPFDCVKVGE